MSPVLSQRFILCSHVVLSYKVLTTPTAGVLVVVKCV